MSSHNWMAAKELLRLLGPYLARETMKQQDKKVCKATVVRCYQCFSQLLLLLHASDQSGCHHKYKYNGQLLTAFPAGGSKSPKTYRLSPWPTATKDMSNSSVRNNSIEKWWDKLRSSILFYGSSHRLPSRPFCPLQFLSLVPCSSWVSMTWLLIY